MYKKTLAICIFFFPCFLLFTSYCLLFSAVPGIMNYNGKLTTPTGIGINDTVDFIFGIYNHNTAGVLLWEEAQNNIPVDRGLFDVKLGRINPINLPFDEFYWLEIIVDGDTLSPRSGLASAPYAFRAAYADSFDGTFDDSDWDRAGNMVFTLYPTDSVGIGIPFPTAKLEVQGDTKINGDLAVTGQIDPVAVLFEPQTVPPLPFEEGKLYYDNTTNLLKVYDSTAWIPLAFFKRLHVGGRPWLYDSVTFVPGPNIVLDQDGDTITVAAIGGAGDNDWTVVGDNLWSFPTGNCGIGAIPPLTKLHIMEHDSGDIFSAATPGDTKFMIKNDGRIGIGMTNPMAKLAIYEADTMDPFTIQIGGITHFFVNNDGEVGIGTGSPLARLHVLEADSSDPFRVAVMGDTKFIIKNDGRVGIDRNTPVSKLHVVATDSTDLFECGVSGDTRFIVKNSGNVGIGISDPIVTLAVYEEDSVTDPLKISSDATTRMIIKNDGKVGIGTSSPTARLSVGYGSTDSGDLFKVSDAGTARLVVDEDGEVGIGTATPEAKVHVYRGASGETPTDVHGIFIENSGTSNSAYAFQTATAGGGKSFSITNLGRIGIGTPDPQFNVHLVGGTEMATILISPDEPSSGADSKLLMAEDDDATYAMGIKYDGGDNRFFIYGKQDTLIHNNHLSINRDDGWVGIGTATPDAALHVAAGSDDAFKVVGSGSTRMIIKSDGKVGIGHDDPQAKLDVRTKILVTESDGDTLVEIGSGLDYAEGFDVTDPTEVSPGMVLCIDPHNPGKLVMSSQPYDKRVAGIVAGANDLSSAIRLGPSEFDHDVALAGRVYCNVDASQEQIEPGDLLTTSSIPGYAMKVTDPDRAQGAILGKAMEPLDQGQKGQILVLVTLQ